MKTSYKINLIAAIIGVVYFIFMAIPLIKSIFGKQKTPAANSTEWVEEPMMIDAN